MPEPREPFQHETLMADETMFARLVAAVEAEMGDVDAARIVRALLAEMRTPSEATMATLANAGTFFDEPVWQAAIDAILAEAGGSGGA